MHSVALCDQEHMNNLIGRHTHQRSLPHPAEDIQAGRTGFSTPTRFGAVTELGRILFPASELERVLAWLSLTIRSLKGNFIARMRAGNRERNVKRKTRFGVCRRLDAAGNEKNARYG